MENKLNNNLKNLKKPIRSRIPLYNKLPKTINSYPPLKLKNNVKSR